MMCKREDCDIQNELYVAAMVPIPPKTVAGPRHPEAVVSNIRVRYTINSRTRNECGQRSQDLSGRQ